MKIKTLALLAIALLLPACGTTTTATFLLRGSPYQTATSNSFANLKNALFPSLQDLPVSGSPKTLYLNVQAFYLGTKSDCTDLKAITDYNNGTEGFDLYAEPILFSANPTPGTYSCLALKINDLVVAKVDETATTSWPDICQTGTNYTKDLYPVTNTDNWKDVTGTVVAPQGSDASPVLNSVTLFGTTKKSDATTGTLKLASSQVFSLTKALSIPSKATFYVDYNDGIQGASICTLNTGSIGFR